MKNGTEKKRRAYSLRTKTFLLKERTFSEWKKNEWAKKTQFSMKKERIFRIRQTKWRTWKWTVLRKLNKLRKNQHSTPLSRESTQMTHSVKWINFSWSSLLSILSTRFFIGFLFLFLLSFHSFYSNILSFMENFLFVRTILFFVLTL